MLFPVLDLSASSPVSDSLASFQALSSTALPFRALAPRFPAWVRLCPVWVQRYRTGVDSWVVTCSASVLVPGLLPFLQASAPTLPSG